MRVLLTAFGSRGDVQPMLALGLGLRDRGHDVAVGAAPNYRVRVEEIGLVFSEIGGDFEPWLKGQSARNPFSVLGSLAAYLRDEVTLCFEQTCAAVRDVDLVVTTIHLAARSAAEAAGVPCRTVLYSPQLLPSRFHPPVAIPPQNLPGWLNRSLWWAMARAFNMLFKRPVNRERNKLGLERPKRSRGSSFARRLCSAWKSAGAHNGSSAQRWVDGRWGEDSCRQRPSVIWSAVRSRPGS